jgi:DNA-binding NarL/FixJ family response regulator
VKRRILLAEDHVLVGEGLRVLLSGEYEVTGPVRDGRDVIGAVERERPDVVMLDLSLPGRSGLDLIQEIVRAHPGTAVVVVTMHAEHLLAERAFQLGAAGFVPKDSSSSELRWAIETVLAGNRYLSPRVRKPDVPGGSGSGGGPEREALARLTPRQLVILRAIGRGMVTEAIAEELGLSVYTVYYHRRNLRRILGVDSEGGLEWYGSRVVAGEGLDGVGDPPLPPLDQ